MCDVFLIDDESDIRIALAQSFELADLNAQFFASVEEALLAIKAQGLPLVIVSDICLPGLSGQNLLSSVLHQDSELPVILITGHGDISMAVKAMHDGAYDFIEKPFAPERLIDTVHRAIEKRRLTLENRQLKCSLKVSQTLGPRIMPFKLCAIPLPKSRIPKRIFYCLVKQEPARSWLPVHCMNRARAVNRILLRLTVVRCRRT